MKWLLGPFRKYADFNGRASRKEFWLFYLWQLAIYFVLGLLTQLLESWFFTGLYLLYSLASLLPSHAVTVRRLHDSNKSGAWLFILLLPIVGIITVLVFLVSNPTPGTNDYDQRLSDRRPWWDTFPWWGVVVLAVLTWMASQIITNDNYELAWTRIWPGLRITVVATLEAFGIALVLGLLFGMGQLSRNVVLRNVARTYVEFVRGVPILPLIFTVALVLVPEITKALNFRLSFQMRATVTLALIYGAYMAEIFRGGIQSIPPGQVEAGRSLGLNRRQTMNSVVLPQAMRSIIPPLGNDFIAVLKDTSLLSVLGVLEITQRARQFSASSFKFREGYFVLAFIYLLLTLGLSLLLGVLERRMTRDRKGGR